MSNMTTMTALDEATAKDFIKDGVAFVQVWSKDCGWCDKQKPVLEKVMQDYPDVKFGALNVNYTKPGQAQQPSEFRSTYLDNYDGAPILARFENGVRTHLVKKAILSESILKTLIEGAYAVEEKPKKPKTFEEYLQTASTDQLKAHLWDLENEHKRCIAELGRRQNA